MLLQAVGHAGGQCCRPREACRPLNRTPCVQGTSWASCWTWHAPKSLEAHPRDHRPVRLAQRVLAEHAPWPTNATRSWRWMRRPVREGSRPRNDGRTDTAQPGGQRPAPHPRHAGRGAWPSLPRRTGTVTVSDNGARAGAQASANPGMGVGLDLVQRMADAQGIDLQHAPGSPTSPHQFTLSWPG